MIYDFQIAKMMFFFENPKKNLQVVILRKEKTPLAASERG